MSEPSKVIFDTSSSLSSNSDDLAQADALFALYAQMILNGTTNIPSGNFLPVQIADGANAPFGQKPLDYSQDVNIAGTNITVSAAARQKSLREIFFTIGRGLPRSYIGTFSNQSNSTASYVSMGTLTAETHKSTSKLLISFDFSMRSSNANDFGNFKCLVNGVQIGNIYVGFCSDTGHKSFSYKWVTPTLAMNPANIIDIQWVSSGSTTLSLNGNDYAILTVVETS